MSSKGEITPEAISLLLRLTPSIERAQELLEADVLSEYWQGVKDTVLMHNKMVLEDKEPTQ